MRINALLISPDSHVQESVAKVFAGTELALRKDETSALEFIQKSHFDSFIIDCDALENGRELIAAARNSRSNRRSVIFTIVNETPASTAMQLGSNFVIETPVDANRLKTYFLSSLHKMEAEHRRYFRYQLTLDAEVVRRDGKMIPAQIFNVSDGGFAIRLLDRAHLQGTATLRFSLPDSERTPVVGVAVVRWSQGALFGIKFTVDNKSRKAYREWLSSMPVG